MKVELAYGREGLTIVVPEDAVVIEPLDPPPLPDEESALLDAFRAPVAGLPLRELVGADSKVAVVFPDITRPMPNRTVLPPLLAELESAGAGPEQVQLLCATGTHRRATAAEMVELVGSDIVERYEVHDHDAADQGHVEVGRIDDTPVLLERRYVDADVRIITGFVEPHFFAGFSGGPKAVCPGLAGLSTILGAHSPARVADPLATWLSIEDNPVHRFIRSAVTLAPPTFSVDVCIDRRRRLTGVFAGSYVTAHRAARSFTERNAVRRVPERFDVVVTTNNGYPLDRNLYQSAKGLAAAERVVATGGTIVMASQCCDGLPPEGRFGDLLRSASSLEDLIGTDAPSELDRWQVQVLGRVAARARVKLYSDGLTDDEVRAAHLEPIADVSDAVAEAVSKAGPSARVCVLPQGPLTVATVAS